MLEEILQGIQGSLMVYVICRRHCTSCRDEGEVNAKLEEWKVTLEKQGLHNIALRPNTFGATSIGKVVSRGWKSMLGSKGYHKRTVSSTCVP